MSKRDMRKNYQRKFNKLIRSVNKNIENDSLWLGRFVVYQTDASFQKFDDNSGGVLYAELRFIDKWNHYYWDTTLAYAPYYPFNEYHMYELMNKFIVGYDDAWADMPMKPIDLRFRYPFDWHEPEKNYYNYRRIDRS